MRALVAAALTLFVWRACVGFARTGAAVYLLAIVAQTLTTVLVVLARRPARRALDPVSVTVAAFATFYFLLIDLDSGTALLAWGITVPLQLAGIGLQIFAKATLGRSFGLLPADRGVVTRGPYAIVRHPIYSSYLLADTGFILGAFSWHNLLLFTLLYGVQVYRIGLEERLLGADPQYRAYRERVRWRLFPRVF